MKIRLTKPELVDAVSAYVATRLHGVQAEQTGVAFSCEVDGDKLVGLSATVTIPDIPPPAEPADPPTGKMNT